MPRSGWRPTDPPINKDPLTMPAKPTLGSRLAAYGILASAGVLGLALALVAIRLMVSFT